MLASLYNSLFILATLEIIGIFIASGKLALLNIQIQKCVGICCQGESSTIVLYNSKEPDGANDSCPDLSDLAWMRLGRREGGKFLSHFSEHLSDVKEGGRILELQRLYDYAGVYSAEDSEAFSAIHAHVNSNCHKL